jgi:cobalt transporter subunit CbtA
MERFRRLVGAGALAGLLVGLVLTTVQSLAIYPLIRAAEVYETAAEAHEHAGHEGHDAAPAWEPAPGLERLGFSTLTNIVVGTGYGLLLTGLFALRDAPVGARRGVLWGLAGFACVGLAPALGLPPALPGAAEAALGARQLWWILTAIATAGGLAALLRGGWTLRVLGLALLALPHLVGAPHGAVGESVVPAALVQRFVVASLGTTALFWLLLGGSAGWLYDVAARRARTS